jgi:RsiW-degrading membrane proteinase PrsW (M82 family)
MAFDILTDIELVAAYFLPILFLMAFVGRAGKKYVIYLFWGFLASVPVLILTPAIIHAIPIANPELTVSPLLEEFFKALPIIIPALIGAKNRDDDLLVCAMASGIGFSLIENIIHVNSDLVGYQLQTIGTSLAGFFQHPMPRPRSSRFLPPHFPLPSCTGARAGSSGTA